MPAIHVAPDKSYGLMRVNERFEIDEVFTHSPKFMDILQKSAQEVTRLAAAKYQLRGWHWRSDLPVEIDKSELQYDLLSSAGNELVGQDQGSQLLNIQGRIAFVVKLWFLVPRFTATVYEPEELAEPDGFVEVLPVDGELATV